jgi:hypothetical protein
MTTTLFIRAAVALNELLTPDGAALDILSMPIKGQATNQELPTDRREAVEALWAVARIDTGGVQTIGRAARQQADALIGKPFEHPIPAAEIIAWRDDWMLCAVPGAYGAAFDARHGWTR